MSSQITIVDNDQLVNSISGSSFGSFGQESFNDGCFDSSSNCEPAMSEIDDKVKALEKFIRENYQSRYVQLIYQESFYPDMSNQSIQLVGQLKETYGNTVLTRWFTRMYNEYIGDSLVLKGLLYTILYYSDSFGDLVELSAQAALSHSSNEINELGVRILESQCSEKHYRILCNLKVRETWLQNYIDKVKTDYKKELCLS